MAQKSLPHPKGHGGKAARAASKALRRYSLVDDIRGRTRSIANSLRRGFPLQSGLSPQPLFIAGPGRSGTTLVRRLITASGELFIPPEMPMLGSFVARFVRLRYQLNWKELVDVSLGTVAADAQFRRTVGLDLMPLANELKGLTSPSRSCDVLIDGLYRHIAAASGEMVDRWGDKTPWNVYSLDRIARVFPKAQTIITVRHPGDVVASYLKAGLFDEPRDALDRWVSSVQHGLSFVRRNPERSLVLRYEDLVSRPAEVSASIYRWIGLSWEESLLDRIDHMASGDVAMYPHLHRAMNEAHIDTSSIGSWETTLQPRTVRMLRHDAGELAAHLGYEV